MMGGSRGDAPAQATAIAGMFEIAELLRNAEKTMPAAIAELRKATAEAKAAKAELDKTVAEHATRLANIAARGSELHQADVVMVKREAACQEREDEHARKLLDLDGQTTLLADRKRDLDRQEGILKGDLEEFKAAKMLQASDHEAKAAAMLAEIDQQRRNSEAELQLKRDEGDALIREMRAKAQQDITAAQELLQAREDKVAGREKSLHSERARISALLQE